MVSSGGDGQVQLLEVGPRPLDLRPADGEGAGAGLHFGFFPGHGDWLTGHTGAILYRYHWELGIASQVALVSRQTCKPSLSTIWGLRMNIKEGWQSNEAGCGRGGDDSSGLHLSCITGLGGMCPLPRPRIN